MTSLLWSRIPHPASRVLLAAAACVLTACGRPAPAPRSWRQAEFLIGLREAPPAEPRHYARVAKAGFRVIVSYVGPDALPLARRYGLKLAVAKIGLDPQTLAREDGEALAAGHFRRFGDHPALWGYDLGEQLPENRIDDVAAVADWLRRRAPGRPFFVDLLGCDAWAGPALRTADYARYLDRALRAVAPPLLAFRHEPFPAEGDSPFYFENLELARAAAAAHRVPFVQAIRCGQWPGLRPLGEGELRWLVYTSLAYGARGVVWRGYWQARDGQGRGIVGPDGRPTPCYDRVAALNRELAVLGPYLMELRSAAVYHAGEEVPAGARRLAPHGLIGGVKDGAFVIGLFDSGEEDRRHVLVVNGDYRQAATAALTVNHACRAVAWLDPAANRWRNLPVEADPLQSRFDLPLPPGSGKLLRLYLAN
ncbi:MAG: hypothetical protein ACODAJ_15910 [Planctomycetota bacterium]